MWCVRLYGSNDPAFPDGMLCSNGAGRRTYHTREQARAAMRPLARMHGHITYRVMRYVEEQLVLDLPAPIVRNGSASADPSDGLDAEGDQPVLHEDDEDEDDGYINEDCPEQCALDHDTDDHFQCEATGVYYARCEECGERNVSGRWDDRTYVENRLVCSGCLDNYSCCYDCGEYVSEVHEIRNGEMYCVGCYEYYLENNGSQGHAEGEARRFCPTCETYNDYMDEMSEAFVCKHEAEALTARKVPVLV